MKGNKREGKGVMVYTDHTIYDGEWASDKREGVGTLKYKGGEYVEGQWVADKLVVCKYFVDREQTRFESTGTGEFRNG